MQHTDQVCVVCVCVCVIKVSSIQVLTNHFSENWLKNAFLWSQLDLHSATKHVHYLSHNKKQHFSPPLPSVAAAPPGVWCDRLMPGGWPWTWWPQQTAARSALGRCGFLAARWAAVPRWPPTIHWTWAAPGEERTSYAVSVQLGFPQTFHSFSVWGWLNQRCCGALWLGFPQAFHSFSAGGGGGGGNWWCCWASLSGFSQTFHSFTVPGGKRIGDIMGLCSQGSHKPFTDNAQLQHTPANLHWQCVTWTHPSQLTLTVCDMNTPQPTYTDSVWHEHTPANLHWQCVTWTHPSQLTLTVCDMNTPQPTYTDSVWHEHTPANLHWQCPASPPPAHASAPSCLPRLPPGHQQWRDDQPGWCHAGTSAAPSGGGWRHQRWRTLRDCFESSLLCQHAWQWAGRGGCWAADRSNLWKVKLSMQQHITIVFILGGEGWDQITNTKCPALTVTEQIT